MDRFNVMCASSGPFRDGAAHGLGGDAELPEFQADESGVDTDSHCPRVPFVAVRERVNAAREMRQGQAHKHDGDRADAVCGAALARHLAQPCLATGHGCGRGGARGGLALRLGRLDCNNVHGVCSGLGH
jgi:hypothetical protein